MTHIIVLTPSLGRVSVAREETWGALVLECQRRGIKLSRNDASDPGLLPHARNVLLAAAVDSDATHAFWWDADVAFDVAGLFELLDRPEAMIVRPYPMRGVDWESVHSYLLDRARPFAFPSAPIPTVDQLRDASMLWSVGLQYEKGKPVWSEDGKLVQVSHSGFGWVLHKAETLRMFAKHGLTVPRFDWHHRAYLPGFAHLENDQTILQGEDVSFCQRWRDHWECRNLPELAIWAAPERMIRNGGRVGRYADYLKSHGLRSCPDDRCERNGGTHPHVKDLG